LNARRARPGWLTRDGLRVIAVRDFADTVAARRS
jgi:hypothetical protein